jgi:hypothetical protein
LLDFETTVTDDDINEFLKEEEEIAEREVKYEIRNYKKLIKYYEKAL